MASNSFFEVLYQLGRQHDRGLDPFGKGLAYYDLHQESMGILLKRVGFHVDGTWLKNAIEVASAEGYPRFTITVTADGTRIMVTRQ